MGDYEVPLQNGMILTVEPGIYISDRIPVPEGQPLIDASIRGCPSGTGILSLI